MDFTHQRQQMVASLKQRGITDPVVCEAMLAVPREAFLPDDLQAAAYQDGPLPIGFQQTISQPLIVAMMTEALDLDADDRVLEIGTGSGYAAAVLSEIAKQVYSVERIAELAETATTRLNRLGYANVHVKQGDGTLGWPEHAPYDAIVVTAGGPEAPQSLLAQLSIGGRLVIPVGESRRQQLLRYDKTGSESYEIRDLGSVRFVPLVGDEGWHGGEP